MDLQSSSRVNKYDRVMSRVYNRNPYLTKPKSSVVRHDKPSSVSVGAKRTVSNVSSSALSELPVVLNDASPEAPVRRKFVVKPRKTVRSLDPATSPHRNISSKISGQRVSGIKSGGSAPTITNRADKSWPNPHDRQCLTSRSHIKLKELKDEIKAYHDADKHMKLRSRLYKSCGVVLNDVGRVATDKAVQAQILDVEKDNNKLR